MATGSPPLLAIAGLRVEFATSAGPLVAVDGVDLELGAGRTLCIVGESGCGKSVTALATMGLLPSPPARVTAGEVRFAGQDLLTLDREAMRRLRGDQLAMIFQEPMSSLNPAFTIGAQVAEAVRCHKPVGKREALEAAEALLRAVRIAEPSRRLAQYPHQLSGGMRQRVMIAMALANRPRLLIADEPTTALDTTVQAQILELLRRLREETGAAVLLITHDLGVVGEVADDVVVMYAGLVVEAGPAELVLGDAQHPYTLGLLASLPERGARGQRLQAIPGAVPPPGAWPAGCRFAARCGLALARCRQEQPPMQSLGAGHRVACWRVPIEEAA